jgi:hypothetical protein
MFMLDLFLTSDQREVILNDGQMNDLRLECVKVYTMAARQALDAGNVLDAQEAFW